MALNVQRRDLHAKEPGQRLQAVPNPGSAMIVRVAREGIDPAEEGQGLRTTFSWVFWGFHGK